MSVLVIKKKLHGIAFAVLICMSAGMNIPVGASVYLKRVLAVPQMRTKFAGFLDNVLKQISSDKFFALLDQTRICDRIVSDKDIYARLFEHKNIFRPSVPLYWQIKSLYDQKAELARQAEQLLGKDKIIEGYVEIGSPGSYWASLKKSLTMTGTCTIVVDKKRWTDSVQSFSSNTLSSLKPYDACVALNDYAEISENALASNSVDLVVCFVGLHHVPQEKLDRFIASVCRILRPGGVFLLREHNSKDSAHKALIYAAHSIYNILITQASVEAEAAEYRNFQNIQDWIELLEKHGLSVDRTQQLTQDGDPTLNTMLKCTKIACVEQDKIAQVAHAVKHMPGYKRDLIQTYLSSPEWLNVDVAQEYGMFIEHTPFYQFPYCKSIMAYWDVFKKSWQTAAQKNGALKTTLSPYTLMNLFVGATMTVEYAAKSLISAPVRWLYTGQEPSKIKLLVKDLQNQIENLDSSITVCKKYPDAGIKLVEFPRSKEFLHVLYKLLGTQVDILEIAGQQQIQVKIRYKKDKQFTDTLQGCTKEYDWQLPTQPDVIYAALTVQVSELKAVLQQLHARGYQVVLVHDY